MVVALYRLSQTPGKLPRLEEELAVAMPDASQLVPWGMLETLLYLSAVIKEALRMAYGTASRLIRSAVSMAVMHLCQHPDIFDEPEKFEPERWIHKNKPTDLFAYAELCLVLAAIVRRFDLTLHDTDFSDVESVCDALMPMPKPDSKGVRVMVS
ncbi:cytochrome P450 [Lentithecium fluviatile CBS 122367]|uniref:Cytochrome P450 n=1 Tax=Lentithecium fluviatile CBS 122367 TaxID=1168545 RepID=A0A6G1IDN2_9PLEO|nr:cytochrome P450 [Lentithecium fluviatile CBS 122367]